ncbi:MAG: quinone-dependent dihydroorotate dehydrogenase [Saprospiraceae bacterium]|nr:quinone-dependent dihydroorotate dehydrogenase [Saprospiraceae bacterium]
MYSLLKPLLFRMDAEKAHHLVTDQLVRLSNTSLGSTLLTQLYGSDDAHLSGSVMNLRFRNPIGMAAGFDKNALYLKGLKTLGFGFVEVGTVTPRPQVGNPKPRLFRLVKDRALLNRMGFNNEGVEAMANRLEKRPDNLIVGGNIGKNKDTPQEDAESDYLKCFERLQDLVDYFVVNVSSPNTPGLRSLQDREPLTRLLERISSKNQERQSPKPILLKIAPDLSDGQLQDVVQVVREQGLQGIVATNTTISRSDLTTSAAAVEALGAGGISGRPVTSRATDVVRMVRELGGDDMTIIGVGGIDSASTANKKIQAGADLIQVYSGLVYEGPKLIRSIKQGLR